MAYVAATLILKEIPVLPKDSPYYDGRVFIVVEFTGNAGEPPRSLRYTVGAGDTLLSIRQWAIGVADNLNKTKSIADALTVGQSINVAPIAQPAQTAEDIWKAKVQRYLRLSSVGWVGAMATDMAALKSNIESTYQPGYL